MQVGGVIAVLIILGLFLSMLGQSPRTSVSKREESPTDTR
jgi:hypothetical protein